MRRRFILMVWGLGLLACGGSAPSGTTTETPPPTQPAPSQPPAQDPGSSQPSSTGAVAVAAFDGTGGSGTAPHTERFDGSGSYSRDAAAKIVAWLWSFGDGSSASGAKVEHRFDAGHFTVTLTVTDSDGSQGVSSLAVDVKAPPTPAPPRGVVAVAKLDDEGSGVAPATATFNGADSHSIDPKATISGCAWDFGDGATASGCWVKHTFASAGAFTVTLVARDSDGSSGLATLKLTVRDPPPGSTRWARSVEADDPYVASDFRTRAAVAAGNTLEGFDPATGSTLWTRSYPAAPSAYRVFWGFGISPRDGRMVIWQLEADQTSGWDRACVYSPDGVPEGCLAGESTTTLLTGVGMGPDGDAAVVALGQPGPTLVGRLASGAQWSVPLPAADWQAPMFAAYAVTTAPGGDAILSGRGPDGFTFDGVVIGGGDVLMRISPTGHLIWWQKTFPRRLMGTTQDGTIVAFTDTNENFRFPNGTFGNGSFLTVNAPNGAPRWAMALPSDAVLGQTFLSVLPSGEFALAINRSSGLVVSRFDLSGKLLWTRDFSGNGNDIRAQAITILPHDVIVSGDLANAVDLGTGELPRGGFLLDLRG